MRPRGSGRVVLAARAHRQAPPATRRIAAPDGHLPARRRVRSTRPAGLPRARAADARLLERPRHLQGVGRAPRRRRRVRLLRRPAVRQRPAALRAPADRLRQGHRAAFPHDDGQQGRPPVRLGLPRPAGRGRSRAAARHLRQGRHPQDGDRRLQRGVPRLGAPLHQGVGGVRHQAGPLGRLRERLQDPRPPLHGERHVGVQAAAREGPDLPGLQGAALLLAVRDPAVQPRAADGRRRLRRPDRPVGHGPVQARDRRVDPGLDHHAVDAAVEPGRRGRPRHHLRRRADAGRRAVHPRPRPAARATRRSSRARSTSARSADESCSAAATSRCSTTWPTPTGSEPPTPSASSRPTR